MTLKIAEGQEPALARLALLEDSKYGVFLAALRDAKPSISLDDLSERTAQASSLDEDDVSQLVHLVASLYNVRNRMGPEYDLPRFVRILVLLASKEEHPALAAVSDWSKASDRLTELLRIDTPLGVSAKAMDVLSETERLYCRGRVVTDLRPIFSIDTESPPVSAVVLHTLRINYHVGQRKEIAQFFVTLEADDLRNLQSVIERAIAKEESLRSFADANSITCLKYKVDRSQ